jgi:hypothetical protein
MTAAGQRLQELANQCDDPDVRDQIAKMVEHALARRKQEKHNCCARLDLLFPYASTNPNGSWKVMLCMASAAAR